MFIYSSMHWLRSFKVQIYTGTDRSFFGSTKVLFYEKLSAGCDNSRTYYGGTPILRSILYFCFVSYVPRMYAILFSSAFLTFCLYRLICPSPSYSRPELSRNMCKSSMHDWALNMIGLI